MTDGRYTRLQDELDAEGDIEALDGECGADEEGSFRDDGTEKGATCAWQSLWPLRLFTRWEGATCCGSKITSSLPPGTVRAPEETLPPVSRSSVHDVYVAARIFAWHGFLRQRHWLWPALLAVWSVGYELAASFVMDVLGDFYLSISGRDAALFLRVLWRSLLITALVATLKAARSFAEEMCAVRWRRQLTRFLHRRYLTGTTPHRLATSANPGIAADNADQRIAADAATLTAKSAEVCRQVLVLPGLCAYYTWYLTRLFGWTAPAACYLYFALAAAATRATLRRVVPLVYAQERADGAFRYGHAWLRVCAESVAFGGGAAAACERRRLDRSLEAAVAAQRAVALAHLPLYVCVQFSEYLGSIVNYAAVGGAILWLSKAEDASQAEISSLVARGSYSCLYLINAFSQGLDAAAAAAAASGSAGRVVELLEKCSSIGGDDDGVSRRLSPCADVEKELHDDSSSRGAAFFEFGRATDSCSAAVLPWLSTDAFRHVSLPTVASPKALNGDTREATAEPVRNGTIGVPSDCTRIGNCIVGRASQGAMGSAPTCNAPPAAPPAQQPRRPLLRLNALTVGRPGRDGGDGAVLISELTLEVAAGEHLLITGPSGSGKTSLLRVLAGLWEPTGGSFWLDRRGSGSCPGSGGSSSYGSSSGDSNGGVGGGGGAEAGEHSELHGVMFVPQRPYCFCGTLLEQLAYPNHPGGNDDVVEAAQSAGSARMPFENHVAEALLAVGLGYLLERESVGAFTSRKAAPASSDDGCERGGAAAAAAAGSAAAVAGTAAAMAGAAPSAELGALTGAEGSVDAVAFGTVSIFGPAAGLASLSPPGPLLAVESKEPENALLEQRFSSHLSRRSGGGEAVLLPATAAAAATATATPAEGASRTVIGRGLATFGDWPTQLSPGELQRVGLARVLLRRPRLAFLDESTAALDEAAEAAALTALAAAGVTLVSVGHRASLRRWHRQVLRLEGGGGGGGDNGDNRGGGIGGSGSADWSGGSSWSLGPGEF